MRLYISIIVCIIGITISCNSTKNFSTNEDPKLVSDTVTIANEEIEYEITIIDGGFTSWFNTNSRPRSFYSQTYLEARNRVWVLEWNIRANSPMNYNSNLYEMQIDYNSYTDYGYEVNYMLYNYLLYFQQRHNQKLGVFSARL
ncbi:MULTISPECIES: DUF6146 family protein [Flavobacterium]|jgi:hypothetical protein|uniref:DUF6146 family protein n=1 Tax=Flavobacterium jumunjinense TaxID=998845 RepID=A0ABV5GIW0_9FLAO|nr:MULTISPECIES: DUF6146 family protein [Flavobacterium]